MTAPTIAERLLALEGRMRHLGLQYSNDSFRAWADELAAIRAEVERVASQIKETSSSMIPDSAALLDCVDALCARLAPERP